MITDCRVATAHHANPWCRWLRFSLRALLVFTFVIGIWLGWLTNSARKQQRAAAWVNDHRGSVYYDFDMIKDAHGNWIAESNDPGWKWIPLPHAWKSPVVIDCEWNVTGAALFGAPSNIQPLADLTRLEFLAVSGKQLSDIKPLARLRSLRELRLLGPITNIDALASLDNLATLSLYTGDVDLAPLAKLQGIRKLHLSSAISDLAPLKKLPQLKTLYFSTSPSADQIEWCARHLPHCKVVVPVDPRVPVKYD